MIHFITHWTSQAKNLRRRINRILIELSYFQISEFLYVKTINIFEFLLLAIFFFLLKNFLLDFINF